MTEVLGVRFREIGKIYYYPCEKSDITVGDLVIVLTKRGLEYGTVMVKKNISASLNVEEKDERIVRKAVDKDLEIIQKNRQYEKNFLKICTEKIKEYGLKMKLVDAEYIFDRSKLVFYFVADNRVDFRSFVRELAYIFKTRIELRQIGVRDEAKTIGGLGTCGKPLCCATFLNDFQSVSVKMAKDQSLSLNPVKISGVCGRLMCCLKYEEDTYLDILYDMPTRGSLVNTPEGKGHIIAHNVISKTVKVILEDRNIETPMTFNLSDIKVLKQTLEDV